MPSGRTLILKLGAIGDVVRTTPLLRSLKGEVTWVTREEARPLLPMDSSRLQVVLLEDVRSLAAQEFDLVVSLDDELEAAQLASSLRTKELVGCTVDDGGRISYTQSSAEWFDMGLLSRFGRQKADELKLQNRKTYQEILFGMVGRQFQGEEYVLAVDSSNPSRSRGEVGVGIETRAGARWPMKRWNRYGELAGVLGGEGYKCELFAQRDSLLSYVQDINACDIIVTGDTLALHLALGLKKRVVGLFICTSPAEIYDYGRLRKIVSPLLSEVFYHTDYVQEAVDAIRLETVYEAVKAEIAQL